MATLANGMLLLDARWMANDLYTTKAQRHQERQWRTAFYRNDAEAQRAAVLWRGCRWERRRSRRLRGPCGQENRSGVRNNPLNA